MNATTKSPPAPPPSSPPFREVAIGILGSLLLRTLNATLRWRRIGFDGQEANWAEQHPRILSFWHGRQLMMPWSYLVAGSPGKSRPMSVLISQHADGRMIARIMKFLRIDSVAGSSTRGGREALFALIRAVEAGSHLSLTPDGPKGPRYKLKEGILRIAQRSGAPIHPITYSAEKRWQFKSWDGMILPKPFSRAVMIMSGPVTVPAEVSAEELKALAARLEAEMNRITEEADNFTY